MFDNLCKSWPRESQQCINRLKNKQTSYRGLNTVLIKVLYERCGSWPQKCYGDGYSTGWLRHFIATRRYEFFNFQSAEARSGCFLNAVSFVVGVGTNFNPRESRFIWSFVSSRLERFIMYFLLDSVFIALIFAGFLSSFCVFFVFKFALSNPVVLLITRPWLRDHTSVSFNRFIVCK